MDNIDVLIKQADSIIFLLEKILERLEATTPSNEEIQVEINSILKS